MRAHSTKGGDTRRTLPSWHQRLFTTASVQQTRARVRLPHTQWSVTFICLGQESNLRAPSSGPAAVLFLPARRESTAASWTCKKEKKKRFQKTLKTTHEQAETAGPNRAFHRDSRFAEEVSVQSGQIFESKGLVSIDRSKAAALLSTTPRLQPRSSTNDLAPLHCMGWVSLRHGARPARRTPECRQLLWLVTTGRAEIGRRPHIVASQRRGANGTVTLLGGILT